jgi:hypothetical protein
VEWWQVVLTALLFVVGGAYATYHALGREKLLRIRDQYTPDWLRDRLGWEATSAVAAEKEPEKPAAPVKLPPSAKLPRSPRESEASGDSSTAAEESLRRYFKRMR